MASETKSRKLQKRQLRVAFDTNALFIGSASDLVKEEVANLISQSVFPDLEIQWYLPEIVRHERQYRMQELALGLLPAIQKVEKLLGHNLAIGRDTLVNGVEEAVRKRREELGLLSLKLDCSKVDWQRIVLDAVYRRPPFQGGEKEKGFRDSMLAECFLQLVADSPKTAATCRIVLVTNDQLVTKAVLDRIAGSTNTAVLATLEDLKGLINTLVSQMDEAFLQILKPKADKLFFIAKDESTLFYKEHIREKIETKFASELSACPPGATTRTNGSWMVYPPNFVKKTGQRIQWTSMIEIQTKASKLASQSHNVSPVISDVIVSDAVAKLYTSEGTTYLENPESSMYGLGTPTVNPSAPQLHTTGWHDAPGLVTLGDLLKSGMTVAAYKGIDVYEVIWSVSVTTARDLRKPSVDDIRHSAPTWEQVA